MTAEQTAALPDSLLEMERLFIDWLIDHGYEFEADGHSPEKHRFTVWLQRSAEETQP